MAGDATGAQRPLPRWWRITPHILRLTQWDGRLLHLPAFELCSRQFSLPTLLLPGATMRRGRFSSNLMRNSCKRTSPLNRPFD